jgi:hypothetical protein
MIAKNRDVSLVVDATTGAPIEVLDVDPWIDDVLAAPMAGAPAPSN